MNARCPFLLRMTLAINAVAALAAASSFSKERNIP